MSFVFVEDADLTTGKLHPTTSDVDDTIEEIQKAIDVWEGCLKTTGGAIRPDKSFAYVLSCQFNSKGEHRFESVEEIEASLSVKMNIGLEITCE